MRLTRIVIALAFAGACLSAAHRYPISRFRCEQVRRRVAERIQVMRSLPAAQRTELARSARRDAAACVTLFPDDYTMLVLKGASEYEIGLQREALESYQNALTVNRRPEIYANIALIQLALGNPEAAKESLYHAAAFNFRYLDAVDAPLRNEVRARVVARIKAFEARAAGTR